jgi:hypothetical protein
MSLCLVNQEGEVLVHRHMTAGPEPFLHAIAPDREDVVVCVEWTLHLGLGWPISAPVRAVLSSWATRAL